MGIFDFFSQRSDKKDTKVEDFQFILCFVENTFSIQDVIKIVKSDIGFTPRYIDFARENVPLTADHLKSLEEMDERSGKVTLNKGLIFLSEDLKEKIWFVYPGHPKAPFVIYWYVNVDISDRPSFRSMITNPNFVVGYCGDKRDIFLQSSSNIQVYKSNGAKPPAVKKNEFGDLEVDISKNPGRRKLVANMWLMSCWKMWFGKLFFEQAPQDHLLKFPNALHVKTLSHDIIEIQLYADPFEADRKENRKVQQAFRDWIKMDELEKKLK